MTTMIKKDEWVAIIGGAGALGHAMVKAFNVAGMRTCNIDLKQNDEAQVQVIMKDSKETIKMPAAVTSLALVVCVAGGWEPTPMSKDYEACLKVWERLQQCNVLPSMQAQCLATKYQCPMVLTSALASLHPCPQMKEYGMAKSCVNMLAASHGCNALVLMPSVLDTPQNRREMPKSDMSKWTPLEEVAKFVANYDYSDLKNQVKFVAIRTSESKTSFTPMSSPVSAA